MNTNKKYIFLTLAVLLLGLNVTGVTYAWYSYSHAESMVNATTIKEKPSVIFTQNEYISSDTIIPVYDEDRYIHGITNEFTVTLPESLQGYTNVIQINLINIDMSPELKIEDYKYELLENNIVISSGNFANLDTNKLTVLPNRIYDITSFPYSYNYKLIIWLSENDNIQNDLMDKNFKAKINVITASKKEG